MCLPSVYLNMLSNIIQWATTFLIPVYRVVETIHINTYNVALHYTPYTQTIHVIFRLQLHNFTNNGLLMIFRELWTSDGVGFCFSSFYYPINWAIILFITDWSIISNSSGCSSVFHVP
jgi:hypothetical protein